MSRKTVQSLSEEVRDLREAVTGLSDQIKVLRIALDEIFDELGWAAQNDKLRVPYPAPLTSMPLDPLAADWELNRMSAADLSPATAPPRKETLFD